MIVLSWFTVSVFISLVLLLIIRTSRLSSRVTELENKTIGFRYYQDTKHLKNNTKEIAKPSIFDTYELTQIVKNEVAQYENSSTMDRRIKHLQTLIIRFEENIGVLHNKITQLEMEVKGKSSIQIT